MVFLKFPYFRRYWVSVCLMYVLYSNTGSSRGFCALLTLQLRQPDSPFHLTVQEESWIPTLNLLPNILGCLVGGSLADEFGRKLALHLVPVLSLIGWCFTATSIHITLLLTGTAIVGFSNGFLAVVVMIYLAETSDSKNRGPLLSLTTPMAGVGLIASNVSVYLLGWRTSALIYTCINAVSFAAVFLVPETPAWLVKNNRMEEACKVLTNIRNNKYEAKVEITVLEENVKEQTLRQRRKTNNIMDYLRGICYSWKQVLVLMSMQWLVQICGSSSMVYYCGIFFESLALPVDYGLSTITFSLVIGLSPFISPFATHTLSRRYNLVFCSVAMTICATVVYTYEMLYHDLEDKPLFWVPFVGIHVYIAFLQVGLQNVVTVVTGEVYPLEHRGFLQGFTTSLTSLSCAVWVKSFPIVFLSSLGIVNTLLSFIVASLASVLFGLFLLPETKGKSLEEIHEYFHPKKPKQTKVESVAKY